MTSRRSFQLKDSLGALKFAPGAEHPIYVRLSPGTVLHIDNEMRVSGLIDVKFNGAKLTVFAEDLLARSERDRCPAEYGG